MSVLYPVAANAEAALSAPKGFAGRERAAEAIAGEPVRFVTEVVGPEFAAEDAARDAYPGRFDDERPGRRVLVRPEDRWCVLRPVAAGPAKRGPVQPVNRDGRRWPAPHPPGPTHWRVSVSYWKFGPEAAKAPAEPARALRRKAAGEQLDAGALRALAQQPLRPVRPQQPLDIGLFETRPPEAPHIVMPDE